MPTRIVFIGCDHGGVVLKDSLVQMLSGMENYKVVDMGTHGTKSVDYPDIAVAVAKEVVGTGMDPTECVGILVCGSGIGVSIAANKVDGIRCALVHDAYTARMSREHNNANMIALGERVTGSEVAKDAVKVFLEATFQEGRHTGRVRKINLIGKEL
jgi:RpiB/LacA/LacB family sugar-phosphate isomerase